jgi:hypothetical protein
MKKTITQIRLSGNISDTPIPPTTPCAVFVRGASGEYRFFGQFTRTDPGPKGIAHWHRTAASINHA